MRRQGRKIRLYPALTLVEMVLSLTIMGIIFAVLLPQLRAIYNSWDSHAASAETLQNGRFLIDHLNRNLSAAARITAVSDSATISGYIEFIDNDANSFRYDVNSTGNYVEFGPIGSLSDLAGPVSQLQFTCYNANDLDTPITDVNSIRSVKVETTLTNAGTLGADMTFSTQAYIRANTLPAVGSEITKASDPWLEFANQGSQPALCQIDPNHYLCAYSGESEKGDAVVLTVDTGTWDVSKETMFRYDNDKCLTPALAQIDQTHYLCAYAAAQYDGWAVVLTVDTGTWAISKEAPFEFDTDAGVTPALAKIDDTHYLCAYEGDLGNGWAVVLTVDTGNWTISKGTPFEFDNDRGSTPALCQIDATHYLCAYTGLAVDGFAVVLTVNTGDWSISKETPFEYDTSNGEEPALYGIDDTHYLCAYGGLGSDGWVNILKVDTGNWTITEEYDFEFDTDTGQSPALAQINQTHCLCTYTGPAVDGWSVVLNVDTGSWTVSKETPLEFDVSNGESPALVKIDDSHYLCAYTSSASRGFAGVLGLEPPVLP